VHLNRSWCIRTTNLTGTVALKGTLPHK